MGSGIQMRILATEVPPSGKKSSNSEFWTNLLGATCIPCAISLDFERKIAQSSVQGLSWWEIDIAKILIA